MFHRVGAAAYKPNLDNTLALANALGNPQQHLKCIHVAGTNGKGSTSHMLASILQAAGYNVGLYTSPHLKDFRERIKINGKMVSEEWLKHKKGIPIEEVPIVTVNANGYVGAVFVRRGKEFFQLAELIEGAFPALPPS